MTDRDLDHLMALCVFKIETCGRLEAFPDKLKPMWEWARLMDHNREHGLPTYPFQEPFDEHANETYITATIHSPSGPEPLPHYASSIADAWLVVEHFQSHDCQVDIRACVGGGFDVDIHVPDGVGAIAHNGYADAAPRAICIAAIRAVGLTYNEPHSKEPPCTP